MKKIRYGVIGLKGIGRRHIRTVIEHEQAELVALVDVDEPLVTNMSRELGIRSYTDFRKMLDDGVVDAVSIATPHHLHGPMGLDCLKAGVHVFMEKPLATRVSEIDLMISVAKRNNLKLAVCHPYRAFRSSQALKRLVDGGAIGKVMRVLWTWGHLRQQSYYDCDPWRGTFRHAGGGVLISQASHEIDLICWLIGQPIRVSAIVGNQLHKVEIEDIASANVLFAGGAVGSLQFSLNQPKGYSVRQIVGDRGIIIMPDVKSLWSDENDQILLGTYEDTVLKMMAQFTRSEDEPPISWKPIQLNPDRSYWKTFLKPRALWRRLGLLKKEKRPHMVSILLHSFIQAILDGGDPLVTAESAHTTIEVINAMFLSAIRKKTVDLPLDREEYDRLFEELVNGKAQVPKLR